jgi:uncharacterized protein with LGFP repeats
MKLPSFEKCHEESRDLLGHPLHEKQQTPDGVGLYQTFEYGSIHWHSDVGAHVTRGAIREAWSKCCDSPQEILIPRAKNETLSKHGHENGWLGYPTSEEYPMSELAVNKLNVSRDDTRPDGIFSFLQGFPNWGIQTPPYSTDPLYAQAQTFQNGLIYWIRTENRCVILSNVYLGFPAPPAYRELKEPEPKGFFVRLFA